MRIKLTNIMTFYFIEFYTFNVICFIILYNRFRGCIQMKSSTISNLLSKHLITLEKCDDKEKELAENIFKLPSDDNIYKVKETESEIKMDILVRISSDIHTIKNIVVICFVCAIVTFIISMFMYLAI